MSFIDGPLRRFLRGDSKLSTETIQQINLMREAKRQQWKQRGVDDKMIDMALDLADQWARGMASVVPEDYPEARAATMANVYPQALNVVAENWIKSLA